MPGNRLKAEAIPTPGPWLVRGEAEASASPEGRMLGIEPATEDQPGGWPYLIRRDAPIAPGETVLHLTTGIQHLADARLMTTLQDDVCRSCGVITRRTAQPDEVEVWSHWDREVPALLPIGSGQLLSL